MLYSFPSESIILLSLSFVVHLNCDVLPLFVTEYVWLLFVFTKYPFLRFVIYNCFLLIFCLVLLQIHLFLNILYCFLIMHLVQLLVSFVLLFCRSDFVVGFVEYHKPRFSCSYGKLRA